MASYQNTSEYYCGMNMDTYPGHYTDSDVYVNQSTTNYQTHGVAYSPENYGKQKIYPVSSPGTCIYVPARRQVIYNNGRYYENTPQHMNRYTPLIPESVPYPSFHLQPGPHHNNQYMAKRHRAQITIQPTSEGNFKAVVKRKRRRTAFTTEQVEALEDIFKTKQYINRDERQVIVNQLQLNDKAVKIWFQNRRLKIKREQDQDLEEQEEISNAEHLEKERSLPVHDRLDSVESQIIKNTDEHGFVTLDDGLMGELANVIDECLTKNCGYVPVEEIAASDRSPEYEPISPASVSNGEDSSVYWRPSEPNESLQILFDLQNMPSF